MQAGAGTGAGVSKAIVRIMEHQAMAATMRQRGRKAEMTQQEREGRYIGAF